MVRADFAGAFYEETDWKNPLEWIGLFMGLVLAIYISYCLIYSLRKGREPFHTKLTVLLILDFLKLFFSLMFRYLPSAPVAFDFLNGWCGLALLAFGIFVQFDFMAAILILVQIDMHYWVPRFRLVWSFLYFTLTFPCYFYLGTLGHEPPSWLKDISGLGRMLFGILCAAYDMIQGITSIVLLSRHLESKQKFTKKGETFVDSKQECTRLFLLSIITFLLTMSALVLDLYRVLETGPIAPIFGVLQTEIICVIAVVYYFQMQRVVKIVLKPKMKKSVPVAVAVCSIPSDTTQIVTQTTLLRSSLTK